MNTKSVISLSEKIPAWFWWSDLGFHRSPSSGSVPQSDRCSSSSLLLVDDWPKAQQLQSPLSKLLARHPIFTLWLPSKPDANLRQLEHGLGSAVCGLGSKFFVGWRCDPKNEE